MFSIVQDVFELRQEIIISRTIDKSVLGVMVEYVKHVRYTIEDRDANTITKQLNRMPLLTKGSNYSTEKLGNTLGVQINPQI